MIDDSKSAARALGDLVVEQRARIAELEDYKKRTEHACEEMGRACDKRIAELEAEVERLRGALRGLLLVVGQQGGPRRRTQRAAQAVAVARAALDGGTP